MSADGSPRRPATPRLLQRPRYRPRHWARELRALGYQVRLTPPAYVKPFFNVQVDQVAKCAEPR